MRCHRISIFMKGGDLIVTKWAFGELNNDSGKNLRKCFTSK